jgi:hypothetical protein
MQQATHYIELGAKRAACGRGLLTVSRTDEPTEVTCKNCLHKLNAPKFIGQHRNRQQFLLTCDGGPWDKQEVVVPEQDSCAMSLPIRVGEHVGRYNLTTGAWVPMETKV